MPAQGGHGGLRHDGDEANFVIIPRPTVRDEQLSLRALGLLTRLVDLPPGWEVNAKRLERMVKEGREAIYAALRELRAAGYYRVERRKGEGGRWVSGTAVAKVARPEWAAEYAEQEAARVAGQPEPVPTWEPPAEEPDPGPDLRPVTDGEETTAVTDVREPVSREAGVREAVDRSPVHREPRPSTEEPLRRSEYGSGDSEGAPHVSREPGAVPPQNATTPAAVTAAPPGVGVPEPDDPEPPTRCDAHALAPASGPCPGCGDARREHAAWASRAAARARAREAAARRADLAAKRLGRLEVARCRMCNDDGLVSVAAGMVRCTHDPSSTTGRGRAEFVAAREAERERRLNRPRPA